ncbi:MAG: VCBS repeat-containing protein, partial [Bdellovibrionales bacterium]|nr:VCBS repeat-containing protein [Bdellovibrionales bacterium]
MRLSCFFLMMAIFAIPSLGQDLLNDVEVKEFEIPGIPLSPGSVSTHSFEPREVGDLNGDGQTELVGLSRYGSLSGVDMEAGYAMKIANIHETFDDAVMLSLLDGNFSSLSNEPLWLAVQSANSKGRFAIYSSGADINSDGWLELVCGTAPSDEGLNGRVHLLSGADGSVLRTLLGDHPDFGVIATGLGDINGDGLPEVVVNTIKGLALYPTP